MQDTPTEDELRVALIDTRELVDKSRAMRKRLRRRHTMNRRHELREMRDTLHSLAKRLRRYIGMSLMHDFPQETDLALKAAIGDLRYERQQIDKMGPAPK